MRKLLLLTAFLAVSLMTFAQDEVLLDPDFSAVPPTTGSGTFDGAWSESPSSSDWETQKAWVAQGETPYDTYSWGTFGAWIYSPAFIPLNANSTYSIEWEGYSTSGANLDVWACAVQDILDYGGAGTYSDISEVTDASVFVNVGFPLWITADNGYDSRSIDDNNCWVSDQIGGTGGTDLRSAFGNEEIVIVFMADYMNAWDVLMMKDIQVYATDEFTDGGTDQTNAFSGGDAVWTAGTANATDLAFVRKDVAYVEGLASVQDETIVSAPFTFADNDLSYYELEYTLGAFDLELNMAGTNFTINLDMVSTADPTNWYRVYEHMDNDGSSPLDSWNGETYVGYEDLRDLVNNDTEFYGEEWELRLYYRSEAGAPSIMVPYMRINEYFDQGDAADEAWGCRCVRRLRQRRPRYYGISAG
jgi:hypothetical protein